MTRLSIIFIDSTFVNDCKFLENRRTLPIIIRNRAHCRIIYRHETWQACYKHQVSNFPDRDLSLLAYRSHTPLEKVNFY